MKVNKKRFGKDDECGFFHIKIDMIDSDRGWITFFHLEDGRRGCYYPGQEHLMKVGVCYVIRGTISYPSISQREDYERINKKTDWPKTRISYLSSILRTGIKL